MLTFTANDSGIHVDQWCVAPCVYLDHWAWRKISDCKLLAPRFASALKSSGGTLVLSWLNLLEFSKITAAYQHQAANADALLESILPNIFFLDPNFHKVISRENEILLNGSRIAPHADIESLRFYAKHNLCKSKSLKLLPEQNLFRLTSEAGVALKFDAFADEIVNRVEALRKEYETNSIFKTAVKKLPKGKSPEYGTRFIARELLGSLLVDGRLPLQRNHAIDVSHAIVTVAYCDYVLLDTHWATQVERTRRRIVEGGISVPVAKVFSGREGEIERFLLALESGQHRPAIDQQT